MKRLIVLVSAVFLAACGGGGGGSSAPTPPPVVVAPPTVTVSLSAPKIKVGESAVLTWSSTGATSCTGLDGSAGIKPISGTETVTATKGGQFKYTISCDGAGGTFKQTAALAVPYPVQRTSYLNFKNINIGPQIMPRAPSFRSDEAITAGHSYGDFFQDGSISMIAASNVFAGVNGFGSIIPGSIYFFKKDAAGNWVDNTSTLLSSADRTGCISPRKVVVADFNGDTKPDAFISCHGIDSALPPGYTGGFGENPRYILSQADGTYKNIDAGFKCYCHAAAAADFNGDGFSDILVSDNLVSDTPRPTAYFLTNNKNGTFTSDKTKLSAYVDSWNLSGQNIFYAREIYTVDFIDANGDGKFDLFLAGTEKTNLTNPALWATSIYMNDGSNSFKGIPTILPLNTTYPLVLDIVFNDGKMALLRTSNDYKIMAVEFVNFQTLTVISTNSVPVKNTVWMTLFNGNVENAFASNPYSFKL